MKKPLKLDEPAIRELLQAPLPNNFWDSETDRADLPDTLLTYLESTLSDLDRVVQFINGHLETSVLAQLLNEYLGGEGLVLEITPPTVYLIQGDQEKPVAPVESAPSATTVEETETTVDPKVSPKEPEAPAAQPKEAKPTTLPPLKELRARAEEIGLDHKPYGRSRKTLMGAIQAHETSPTDPEPKPEPEEKDPEPPKGAGMLRTGDAVPVTVVDLGDAPETSPEPESPVGPETPEESKDPEPPVAAPTTGASKIVEEEEPCERCGMSMEDGGYLHTTNGVDEFVCESCYKGAIGEPDAPEFEEEGNDESPEDPPETEPVEEEAPPEAPEEPEAVEEAPQKAAPAEEPPPEEDDDILSDILGGSSQEPLDVVFEEPAEGPAPAEPTLASEFDDGGFETTFSFGDDDVDLLESGTAASETEAPAEPSEALPEDVLANDPKGQQVVTRIVEFGQAGKEQGRSLEEMLNKSSALDLDKILDE